MCYILATNCKRSLSGEGYIGSESKTKSAQPCLQWEDMINTDTLSTDIIFHEGMLQEAARFCRSPLISTEHSVYLLNGPWCFVNTSHHEYCHVNFCSEYPLH